MKHTLLFALAAVLLAGCGTAGRSVKSTESVNIGYGTLNRDEVTTAVSKLDVRKNEIQTYNTIYDYLRGRVPGVMVSTDNRIVIRGIGTNSDHTDPLILVDGVEMTDISGINPADVKSVEVIKDGSSAIYGMQGANGVILIELRHQ